MGYQEDSRTSFGNRLDFLPEETSAKRIDVIGRFIQYDDPARPDYSHTERDETADTAGGVHTDGLFPLIHFQAVDEFTCPALDFGFFPATDSSDQFDSLKGCKSISRSL